MRVTTADFINEYFGCFESMDEIREIMQEVIDAAICSPEADSWDTNERADMIFFCKQTVLLVEAVHQLAVPLSKLAQLLSEPAPDK